MNSMKFLIFVQPLIMLSITQTVMKGSGSMYFRRVNDHCRYVFEDGIQRLGVAFTFSAIHNAHSPENKDGIQPHIAPCVSVGADQQYGDGQSRDGMCVLVAHELLVKEIPLSTTTTTIVVCEEKKKKYLLFMIIDNNNNNNNKIKNV